MLHLCSSLLCPFRNHLQAPVGLVMRLVTAAPELAEHFISAVEGLGAQRTALFDTLLMHSQPILPSELALVVDTTAAFAHLARTSSDTYPALDRMDVLDYFAR